MHNVFLASYIAISSNDNFHSSLRCHCHSFLGLFLPGIHVLQAWTISRGYYFAADTAGCVFFTRYEEMKNVNTFGN